MRDRLSLDVELAKSLLKYDPDTGIFHWRVRRGGTAHAGTVAGRKHKGYIEVAINKQRHGAHRLAWALTHGDPGDHYIDHINGITYDNRIANLRLATNRENLCNQRVHRDGKLPGCNWHKRSAAWRAYIKVDGKSIHLGTYSTEEAANNAYNEARSKLPMTCV